MPHLVGVAMIRRLVTASVLLVACLAASIAIGQQDTSGPTDPKARKTFADADQWAKTGQLAIAIERYRKADQQDGGHCTACLNRALSLAERLGDYKLQESILRESLLRATNDETKATIHFQLGVTIERHGLSEHGAKQTDLLNESCHKFQTALQLDPSLTAAHYGMGATLAYLRQDDAARSEFSTFLKQDKENAEMHERAARYVDRIELARARMAPPFELTTLDGQRISMDGLKGKVVLIDFWATWCGPCVEALPHIRKIARTFESQPFVVLSVSLDKDAAKWKDFVAKNGMTWLQCRDGDFDGAMAKRFAVNAIPATFSIDADGVLEDQHVGDENIEGKLKKMIARAVELQNKQATTAATAQPAGSSH